MCPCETHGLVAACSSKRLALPTVRAAQHPPVDTTQRLVTPQCPCGAVWVCSWRCWRQPVTQADAAEQCWLLRVPLGKQGLTHCAGQDAGTHSESPAVPVAANWRKSSPDCFVSSVPPAELPAAASSSWLHCKRCSRAGCIATSTAELPSALAAAHRLQKAAQQS